MTVDIRETNYAITETINWHYKNEVIKRQGLWRNVVFVELAIFDWVHCFNNDFLL